MAITQDPTTQPQTPAVSNGTTHDKGHAKDTSTTASTSTVTTTQWTPYPGGTYVTSAGADALRAYKYSGADLSLLYIHVLTPMNKWLIQFVPLWMAPNLITFIGLLVTASAHLMTIHYASNFGTPLPSWCYIYVGLSLFAYQTIDNLDGRQARRTGASSPLGLLFDHGVDALNTTVSSLTIAAVYDYGSTWKLFALWGLTILPFAFATWEEYYTGQLILPVINGPSDGVMIVINFCFLGYLYPGFWTMNFGEAVPMLKGTIISDYRVHMFVVVVGYIGLIPTIGTNILAVYRTIGGHHGSDITITGKVSFLRKLMTLAPFLGTWALGALWAYFSPSQVFQRHPRIFLFSLGFLFCNLVCKLMLAHLCNMEYKIMRSVMIPIILLSGNSIISGIFGFQPLLDENHAVYIHLALTFTFWFHFVVYVIHEITTVLHISAFTIDYEKAVKTNASLIAAEKAAKLAKQQ